METIGFIGLGNMGGNMAARLAGLQTLVLHGLDDRLVPPSNGRELAGMIPGARLMEIPDAGHMIATDAEQAVASAVLDHLESARRRNLSTA